MRDVKEISDNIWIEKPNVGEFRAFLSLGRDYINSHDPLKNHRTSKEALAALKKRIKNEIGWLEGQIRIIDENLK